MPRIYRSMRKAPDGKPEVGGSARCLGIRVGQGENNDVEVNANGMVGPGAGGMSVAPRWQDLPPYRVPSRLDGIVAGASGSNLDACFAFGEGEFKSGKVFEHLCLRLDSATHGMVEPDTEMPLQRYEEALAATRSGWEIDETQS